MLHRRAGMENGGIDRAMLMNNDSFDMNAQDQRSTHNTHSQLCMLLADCTFLAAMRLSVLSSLSKYSFCFHVRLEE